MPGPALYVVAAAAVIGTVAAVFAFKEFVYEPHIAPTFEAWSESIAEHRRRNRVRRQGPIAVPVMSENRPADLSHTADKNTPDSDDNDGMSVELEDLVAKEVAEWKSTGPTGTLRRRKHTSGNVLDESNIFIPFDPISPTQVTVDSSAPSSTSSSPAPGPSGLRSFKSSPPIIHSPLPRTPAKFDVNMRPAQHSPASRNFSPLTEPGVPLFRAPSNVSASVSVSARSESRSSSDAELAHSTSSASSFTPAVIGPRSAGGSSHYGTPRTGSVRAYDDVMSLPSSASGSRVVSPFVDVGSPASQYQNERHVTAPVDARSDVSSPFTDIHAVSPQLYMAARSPSPVVLSPGMSSLHFHSESDMAILSPSLRSEMFSPTITASSGDDPFDDVSDLSSWASVGRRTPEV